MMNPQHRTLLMALPVHFLTLGLSVSRRDIPVKLRVMLVSVGLALLLGAAAIVPHKASAQETASEEKRKVRSALTPEYPALAKQMNVTGKVKIEATVAADGHVVNTQVVGGSPLLVNAALDALKKWRFEPRPKETTEIVEFEFSGQE